MDSPLPASHPVASTKRASAFEVRTEIERIVDASPVECIACDQLDYFLCGPPGLIHDTLEALAALGVPEHRVHTEQFDMA